MVKSSNTFLADELGRNRPRPNLTVMDGFRFGLGAIIAVLLITITVGGLTWALIVGVKLR